MTESSTAFGVQLRAYRQSACLSQEELAARSGVSLRAIGDLERGRTTRPYPNSVRRLADALGLRGLAREKFAEAAAGRLACAAAVPAAAAPTDGLVLAADTIVIPRQLPGSVRQFAGRGRELAALTGLLGDVPSSVVIAVISGTAGVGKTALALHWAHQAASRFPDGQLFVNLRGFGPSCAPVRPAQVLRQFLDALAVPAGDIPAQPAAQVALYRSLLGGKRMLIVLDNAYDAAQVRPLLPGSPGCLVLVTSRNQLAGLIATEDACPLTLDVLSGDEARELLARRLGPARLDAEPAAAMELVELCARLPLGLAVAAARAAARPWPCLATIAEELKRSGRRLDALETEDAPASVRAVFSWSMRSLPAAAAGMFRLLGLHPGPDITASAAASLAGISPPQARRALDDLARAHLIAEHLPGRYACHDLLRAYAVEQAQASDRAARQAASRRMVDYYLHTAAAADRLLHPVRRPIVLAAPEPGTTVDCFAELSDALAWFSAEHQVLAAVAAVAADSGLDSRAWQLAWAMETFWQRRVDVHEACRVQLTALAAARRQRDLGAQIAAHRGAAAGLIWLGRHADAIKHLDQALSLARKTGDPAAQARVHMTICDGLGRQERHREALIHARQALRLARTSGDIAVLGMALNSVGWFMAKSGGYQRALSFCQHALALQRRAGDVNGMLYTLDSLAYVHRKLGHHAEAVTVSRQAVELMIRTGHRYDLAMALADIGDARQAAGEPRRAREAWRQARDILAGYEGLIDEGIARVRDSGVSRDPIGARDRH